MYLFFLIKRFLKDDIEENNLLYSIVKGLYLRGM